MVQQKHGINAPQLFGLLTGNPGTGKTFTIQTIIDINNNHLHAGMNAPSAYNGINSTHVDGQTLVSLIHIGISESYK